MIALDLAQAAGDTNYDQLLLLLLLRSTTVNNVPGLVGPLVWLRDCRRRIFRKDNFLASQSNSPILGYFVLRLFSNRIIMIIIFRALSFLGSSL